MTLLENYLHGIADRSDSYFQAHLAREDLVRVRRLAEMAAAIGDPEKLRHDALYIGWTPGDLRTIELKDQLLPLIDAFHAAAASPADEVVERRIMDRWKAFHEARIRVLIHCL